MKKIIFGILISFVFTACNQTNKKTALADMVDSIEENSTSTIDAERAPIIKFDKLAHDFGKIKANEKVSFDFVFTNTGKTPLIISNAVASCGCTVPEIPKEPILAGAKGKINVVFNSVGKSGLQDKVVTITANTIPAQTEIHLTGEVIK
jgi:hypothetical protein